MDVQVGIANHIHDHGNPRLDGYFLDTDGSVSDMGEALEPRAINNGGVVVGKGLSASSAPNQAFLWNGRFVNIHTTIGIEGPNSDAFDINDAGVIVGDPKRCKALLQRFAPRSAGRPRPSGGSRPMTVTRSSRR